MLGALWLAVALGAASQEPAAKTTNLQVLAKDSTAADIKSLMDRYTQELGVSCDYCHSQDPRTQKLDYASDDNPKKQTARVMIVMLNEINTKYLAQLDDQKYAMPVSCGNCHRGQTDPPEFEPKPRAAGGLTAGAGRGS
jgi:hypothetical protein